MEVTTSSESTRATCWATCGLRSVTVRSMTCELPSPLTAMSLPVKLLRLRFAPAACSARVTADRPVAMA